MTDNSGGVLFSASIPCREEEQIAWARETMETLDAMEYGDWTQEDLTLMQERLGLDEDGDMVWNIAEWDLTGDEFVLHAGESGNVEIAAAVFQAFIQTFCPKHTMVLSYAITPSVIFGGEYSGGAILITADELEMFDAAQLARNKLLEKKQGNLVDFGNFEGEEEKRNRWWYSLLGTTPTVKTFKDPVSETMARRAILRESPRVKEGRGDLQLWATRPGGNASE